MIMPRNILYCCVLTTLMLGVVIQSKASQLNWIGHWKGESSRERLILEVKKEFEYLYPNLTVNLTYNKDLKASDNGGTYKWRTANTIAQMISSGDVRWDVIPMDVIVYRYVAQLLDDPLWGRKHLVDFSEVPGFLAVHKSFITEEPFYPGQTGGMYVGPMTEGYVNCFYYNTDVARKVGVDIQPHDMSVDTLLSYAKRLQAYNQTHDEKVPLFSLCVWNRLDTLFEHLFRTHFKDPRKAVLPIASKEKHKAFLKTLQLFETLSNYQPVLNDNWQTLGWTTWEKEFIEGSALFIVAGTYMFNHFESVAPSTYHKAIPVEFPYVHYPNALVGTYTSVFAVIKNSPNRKQAIDLLMLWTKPHIVEKWVQYTRNPTGIKGHLADPLERLVDTDVYRLFISSLIKKFYSVPVRHFQAPTYAFGPLNPISANELRENLALILAGEQTAKDYYGSVLERVRVD